MCKAFGLQNTNVIYNMLYLQYLKKCGYIWCPKKRYQRPTNSKAENTHQTPAMPPSQAKLRPTQTQRSRPPRPGQHRARNTSPSAALTHQPSPSDPGSPDPETQASQKIAFHHLQTGSAKHNHNHSWTAFFLLWSPSSLFRVCQSYTFLHSTATGMSHDPF